MLDKPAVTGPVDRQVLSAVDEYEQLVMERLRLRDALVQVLGVPVEQTEDVAAGCLALLLLKDLADVAEGEAPGAGRP